MKMEHFSQSLALSLKLTLNYSKHACSLEQLCAENESKSNGKLLVASSPIKATKKVKTKLWKKAMYKATCLAMK